MNTRKVLVRYDEEVIPGEEEFESVFTAKKGREIQLIEKTLHSLKMILKEGERVEVVLAPDLAVRCFRTLMLRRKNDESFVPEGITLVVALFSGPSMPES